MYADVKPFRLSHRLHRALVHFTKVFNAPSETHSCQQQPSMARIAMFSVILESMQPAWQEEGAEYFIAQVEPADITTRRGPRTSMDAAPRRYLVRRQQQQVRVHGRRGGEHSTHAHAWQSSRLV